MKKLLLGLGTLAAVAAPVATVIACGGTKEESTEQTKITKIASDTSVDQTEITKRASVIQPVNTIGALVEFDGVTYYDLETFLKAWTKQVQLFIDGSEQCKQYNIKTVKYSVSKDGILISLIGSDGKTIVDSTAKARPGYPPKVANNGVSIFDFNSYVLGMMGLEGFSSPKMSPDGLSQTKFIDDHKLVIEHLDPIKTNPKNSGVAGITDPDKLLASEASKLTEVETTDHNFMRVGGKDLEILGNKGVVGLENEGGGDWSHSFAEFRPGDYIDFVFKDSSSIENFSKKVFYDNTLDAKNISAGSTMSSIYFSKFIVKNDEVVAAPEETGKFQSEGTNGNSSIYSLKAVKKNVIRMTFTDMFDKETEHLDAQIIYLKGFSDVNNDGVIDSKDEQMTPTFCIDGGVMYQNYLQPYDKVKNYWHKGITVGMHEQTIIDYLNK